MDFDHICNVCMNFIRPLKTTLKFHLNISWPASPKYTVTCE